MKPFNLLQTIERLGNRLPNPAYLFVLLCAAVLVCSWLAGLMNATAVHPVTGQTLHVVNLLSQQGVHRMLTETVSNFVNFAPVGTVLVAVIGIAVAEHSGLLGSILRATLLGAPPKLMTFAVVLAGVLSSLAADTGYVVLIPLAALIYHHAGRNPLLGILAAFAGVSGGFSANLMIGPVDAVLAGISTEAAALVAPTYTVNAAGNYYFIVASTLLIGAVGTWVAETLVAPRLAPVNTAPLEPLAQHLEAHEKRGLVAVALFSVGFVGLLLAGLVPADGWLRDPVTGTVLASPFIQGIVTVIAFYAALAGVIFGRVSGHYRRASDCIAGMEQQLGLLGGYLVLMFFAAQFVNYFAWSNLGAIIAILGAEWLQTLAVPHAALLLGFILLVAFVNLFIGSASGKWALIAPIFVPMLMLTGLTPEVTQMAYRIGDSSTNIITPLMPYFGVVVAFAQKYQKDIGLGSIMANMLPFSLCFLVAWTALLMVWVLLDWPLGPGAFVHLPAVAAP